MDILFSVARKEIRLYKPLTEVLSYPVYSLDITKIKRYKPGQLCDPATNDLPTDRLMMAQYKNDEQSVERSNYFTDMAKRADSVYEKIIYLNRAIDTDIINRERYINVIEYYRLLIADNSPLTDDLEKEIVKYNTIIETINEYSALICSVPVLFDTEADKRVELDSWVLNNRRDFPSFINDAFLQRLQSMERNVQYAYDSKNNTLIPVKLLKHQIFISDFLSRYTPYRGCLLYYGLGSGKTLSSINIAEGIHQKSLILLPASIRSNFRDNIEKKGNTIYHNQNQWCFNEVSNPEDPASIQRLKKMGYPVEEKELMAKLYITLDGKRGFWSVQKDPAKDANNFEAHSEIAKKSITDTVNTLINYKYHFANYNGGGGLLRKIMVENVKGYLEKERVIIFNLFGKFTEYSDLSYEDKKKFKNAIIEHIFNPSKEPHLENPFENKVVIIDEVHNLMSQLCNGSDNALKLYELMIRTTNSRIVALSGTPIINSPFELSALFNLLKGYTIFYQFKIVHKTESNLKPIIDELLSSNEDIEQYNYQPVERILNISKMPFGFKRNKEGLAVKNEVELTIADFISKLRSDFRQFSEFELVGNEFSSIFPDIFDKKSMNDKFVVNKKTIMRARDQYYQYYVDRVNSKINNEQEFMIRSLGIVSFFNESYEYDKKIFPDKIMDSEPNYVYVSDYQLIEYNRKREIERQLEKKDLGKSDINVIAMEIDSKVSNVFKVFSRQRLLFTFPPEVERPELKAIRNSINEITCADSMAECNIKDRRIEEKYNQMCSEAIDMLKPENLTINDDTLFNLRNLSPKYAQMLENIRSTPGLIFCYSQFRNIEGIEIFCRVLEANGYEKYNPDTPDRYLTEDKSSHIFIPGNAVRMENGENNWISTRVEEITDDGLCRLEGIENPVEPERLFRCRFATWSGTETTEQREVVRSNFNDFNNRFGSVLLIILTTSSGAEGIDLQNVRQVHIMEPYWNRVRVEQVIGRARRNYSHINLPKEQQNVRIFQYVSRFTESQINGTWGQGLDIKKITEEEGEEISMNNEEFIRQVSLGLKSDNNLTSDQALLKISDRKYEIISQFLDVIKRSAVDCVYNNKDNELSDPEGKRIECFTRVPGTSKMAFDINRDPETREEEVLEKRINKEIYILPYPNQSGNIVNLIYEINVGEKLEELKEVVPLYNFYSYYGINPLIQDKIGTKRLIGSIMFDSEIKRLKLVLSHEFMMNINIYEGVEKIIGSEPIPPFDNRIEVYKFGESISHNPDFLELSQTPPIKIESRVDTHVGKKKVRLNIKSSSQSELDGAN